MKTNSCQLQHISGPAVSQVLIYSDKPCTNRLRISLHARNNIETTRNNTNQNSINQLNNKTKQHDSKTKHKKDVTTQAVTREVKSSRWLLYEPTHTKRHEICTKLPTLLFTLIKPSLSKYTRLLLGRLVGLVVKASASRAEDPGFESRLRRDFFRGGVIPVT